MVSTLRRLDPLVWFLLVGGMIYGVATVLVPQDDEHTIHIDRTILDAYLRSGGGEGNARQFARGLAGLTPAARRELVDRYVEEQALYRAALDMGLDREDVVIRRRLGQTMRYLLQPADVAEPTEEQLRTYLRQNRSMFSSPARLTLEHVFFDDARSSAGGAKADAVRLRQNMPTDWLSAGNRFAYQRSYADIDQPRIASTFGEPFARTVFGRRMPLDQWTGPIRSQYGWHLVRLIERKEGGAFDYAKVRAAVRDAWMRQRADTLVQKRIDEVVGTYDTAIAPDLRSALQ